MLALIMFVSAPLQAAGILAAHHFGIAFALVLLAAVFVFSGSLATVLAILVGIALVAATSVMRLREPSDLDMYLDATAWMICGVTLAVVVGRAVSARGEVSYHRVTGAVLVYFNVGLIFTSLFCFVILIVPKALSGIGPLQDDLAVASNLVYFSFVTLIGELYPATLLARLVTLELESRRGITAS
jgi:hypothetical protein